MKNRDTREEDSSLNRGWYPVIVAGIYILVAFTLASIARHALFFLFAPIFVIYTLTMIFGSAYVIRVLLRERH